MHLLCFLHLELDDKRDVEQKECSDVPVIFQAVEDLYTEDAEATSKFQGGRAHQITMRWENILADKNKLQENRPI